MSKRKDYSTDSLATINAINIMEKMLDIVQKHKKDLESVGSNIFKSTLGNQSKILLAIANTAGNSTANDLFIDSLTTLYRETYDDFPNANTMKDLVLDCLELYWIAVGKHFQSKEKLFDKSLLKAFGEISLHQRPRNVYYDKNRKKEEVKTFED